MRHFIDNIVAVINLFCMELLSKEHVGGASKHDWKFLIKLIFSGAFTAFGLYKLGYNLELAFATLIFIPAAGIFFTFLKHEADSDILRWISILVFAALFGLLMNSVYLAVAAFLIMEGATHKESYIKYEDTKWMRVVRAESSMNEINSLVSGHTIFKMLPKEKRAELADQSTVMEVEAGAYVIKQGEFNCYLFLIAKGDAEVIHDDEMMETLRPGNIFGEVSVCGLSMPIADVVAKTDVMVFAFPADLIIEVTKSFPEFGEQLRMMGMQIMEKYD